MRLKSAVVGQCLQEMRWLNRFRHQALVDRQVKIRGKSADWLGLTCEIKNSIISRLFKQALRQAFANEHSGRFELMKKILAVEHEPRNRTQENRKTYLTFLMNPITRIVLQLQELTLLTWRVIRGFFKAPRYWGEMFRQMDLLGFGSLAIIILTGTFTGMVLALNSANALQKFGVQNVTGQLVATSLIRELGPVLTSLMLAGRVGSGIAAELGSMLVSEQIDAMRALGTDPIKKLVTPRIVALVMMAPALTVICDFVGAMGGLLISMTMLHQSSSVYLSSAMEAVNYNEILGGLIKPTVFGFIIALVGCHKGLSTKGGTVGVGRSTTESVVNASILVIAVDFLLSKVIISLLLDPR